MIELTAQEVMAIIPNRYPIFFIDKVTELIPGEKVVAWRNITITDPIFQGHFPGNPVYPGALIVETLAQAGSITLFTMEGFEGKTAFLGGLKQVKFRQMVVPGDVLRLEIDILKLKQQIGSAYGAAYVGGKKVCECEMTFIIGANDHD